MSDAWVEHGQWIPDDEVIPTITVVGRPAVSDQDFYYQQEVNRWVLDDKAVLTHLLERTARLLDEEAGEACEVNRVILPTEMWDVVEGEVVAVHLPIHTEEDGHMGTSPLT